jgi:hypothetical protein
MATLANLVVKLVGDVSDYESAMKAAEEKTKAVGSKMTSIGKGMTAGVTLPIVGMGLVAVNAASDMEESMSKVSVVFGDNADEIMAWSETAATSMGQSQQAALEAVGTYGNLLTAIGVNDDAAVEMSKTFVELAGDLASFNNASPEETLLALRSALSGEFEPMKRFGVALNQAAIEQQALKMGLIQTKDELTPAIKAQAGYALILEQTETAQGDFIRTSDGLANSQRILSAQFQDAAASIGQQLLPIALELVNVVRGWLEQFQGLSPEMQRVIVIVAGIAAAIGPLLIIVGSLVGAIGSIIPVVGAVVGVLSGPLLLVIGAVIAAVALLVAAWKNNWGDIQGKTKAAIEFVRNIINAGLEWIRAFWDQHGEQIKALVQAIWDGVRAIFDWFVNIVKQIFEAFQLAFSGDWEAFGAKLREIWDQVWEDIKTALSAAWDFIKDVVAKGIEAIIKWFTETDWLQVGKDIIIGIANGITAATRWVIDAVRAVAGAIWDTLKGFFDFGSPSRLMVDLGKKLMVDWAGGMDAMSQIPAAAMVGASNRIVGAGAVAVGREPRTVEPDANSGRSSVVVYGGLHLHGVEDRESLMEQLQDITT